MRKIVIAGAGAYSFAPAILEDLLIRYREACDLWLVDADLDLAELTARAARAIAEGFGIRMRFFYTTQLKKAVPGADAVVVCADFLDDEAWRKDFEALDEVGLGKQVRLSGGLGGLMQTLRVSGFIADLAEQMRLTCSENTRLILCDSGYGGIQLCRACEAARIMGAEVYGISAVTEQTQHRLSLYLNIPRQRLKVITTGLNGFSWVSVLEDRKTGEDLIPRCMKEMQKDPREALSAQYIDWYGAIPAGEHVMQYELLADTELSPRRTVLYSGIGAADYELRKQDLAHLAVHGLAHEDGLSAWRHMHESGAKSVHPVRVLRALDRMEDSTVQSLVHPCDGCIPGVSAGRFVEGPAVIENGKVKGTLCTLPVELQDIVEQLSLCNLLYAEAAAKGDREALREGLQIDPALSGVDLLYAEEVLARMIEAQADRLPRFAMEE